MLVLGLHGSFSEAKSGLIQRSTSSSSRAILGRSAQPCKLWSDAPLYHQHCLCEKSNSLFLTQSCWITCPFFCLHDLPNLLSAITLGYLSALPLTPFPSLIIDFFSLEQKLLKFWKATNLDLSEVLYND